MVYNNTEVISNSQSVNPNLNFSWSTNSGAVTSIAFRKKKSVKKSSDTTNTSTVEVAKSKAKQFKHSNETRELHSGNQQGDKLKLVKNTKKSKNVADLGDAVSNAAKLKKSNKFEQNIQSSNLITKSDVNIKRKAKKDKQSNVVTEAENHTQKTYSLFSEKPKSVYVETSGGTSVSEKIFTSSGSTFGNLSIHKHLVSNLEKMGFKSLTTVQEKAIPIIFSGKDTLVSDSICLSVFSKDLYVFHAY